MGEEERKSLAKDVIQLAVSRSFSKDESSTEGIADALYVFEEERPCAIQWQTEDGGPRTFALLLENGEYATEKGGVIKISARGDEDGKISVTISLLNKERETVGRRAFVYGNEKKLKT